MKFLLIQAMAAYAPAHVHLDWLVDDIHAADIAVAGRTGDARADMGRMNEMNIAGLLVDTHPGNRLTGYVILANMRDLRVCDGNIFVTAPADFYRRVIGITGGCRRPMAVSAGNMQLVDMNTVIKCDWLSWAGDPTQFVLRSWVVSGQKNAMQSEAGSSRPASTSKRMRTGRLTQESLF